MTSGSPTSAEPQQTVTADVLLDNSAAVPLVLTSHDAHEATVLALEGRTLGMSGHAWFEAYSVLTRLPPPARRGPAEVAQLMAANFPATVHLGTDAARALSGWLAQHGVTGGSVYDALVGQAAVEAGLPLATRDRRAVDLYRRLGVTLELLP
ncbi:type II toxin-antitoxin system VapC family toxin [soil metagenome]